MEFSPGNPIVKLCLQALAAAEKGTAEEALQISQRAWSEASNNFEKFMAAFFVAKHQHSDRSKLKWFQTSLQHALSINDASVNSALYTLYSNIAKCEAANGDQQSAKHNEEQALLHKDKIYDSGPFYHGTKAQLQAGDFLNPGKQSNYKDELVMNHVYFTALVNGAGLAAALAKGDGPERVYMVEPTGSYENDPNLTDKKFPGNLTRSYRTAAPLKIVGEVPRWARQSPGNLEEWRQKLANNKGDIIN